MKLIIHVAVEKIQKKHSHTFRCEDKEVEVKYITRSPTGRTRRAFYYTAHYEKHKEEIKAYSSSNIDDSLNYGNISRKTNKKFNPKKLYFINDVCAIQQNEEGNENDKS